MVRYLNLYFLRLNNSNVLLFLVVSQSLRQQASVLIRVASTTAGKYFMFVYSLRQFLSHSSVLLVTINLVFYRHFEKLDM